MENTGLKLRNFFSLRRLEVSLAVGLIAALLAPMVSFACSCDRVRSSVVRLHVLADSDSEFDQRVKLAVRDEVLKLGCAVFDGEANVDNASRLLAESEELIENCADRVISEMGADYKADAFFTEEYFETREYDTFTLPAGRYKAVKIVLGSGKGHNWWCVMFPPLCLSAAEGNDAREHFGDDYATVSGGERFAIRFKIVEVFEKILNREEKQ